MENRTIHFYYGEFNYTNHYFKDISNHIIPIIKGKFKLNFKPILPDLNKIFCFYNLFDNNYQQLMDEIDFNSLNCLGPYFPYLIWKNNNKSPSDWPNFSSIVLNTKSGKLAKNIQPNVANTFSSDSPLLNISAESDFKGRIQQLEVLSNFFGHSLQKANLIFDGTLIPVPAKPMYTFNSINVITKEFSKMVNLPVKEVLTRNSNDIKNYSIIDEYRG
ncbi:MAG: hypothetical protein ACTSWL_05225 [Promethearchaeota archaeon]